MMPTVLWCTVPDNRHRIHVAAKAFYERVAIRIGHHLLVRHRLVREVRAGDVAYLHLIADGLLPAPSDDDIAAKLQCLQLALDEEKRATEEASR
jgi:hypothetical protein